MGVPVIASNLGGFTETVVEGETGLLVPPGSAQALAAALERLIDAGASARAAMGQAGRQRVAALYSTAALQAATMAVYQRLLGQTRNAAARQHQPAL
jgi:glycosyltransferase involved in cell wall biosynthesis